MSKKLIGWKVFIKNLYDLYHIIDCLVCLPEFVSEWFLYKNLDWAPKHTVDFGYLGK